MNRSLKIILPLFIVLGLAQWLVPGQMILKREKVLSKGHHFKFRTQPVDPSHPFVGRYIILNFEESTTLVKSPSQLSPHQSIYVQFGNDSAGYAHITNIFMQEPVNETAYVKANVAYTSNWGDSTQVRIDYPFTEYYMEESSAPKAEEAYLKANQDSVRNTYARVKIWKGAAVIEDVLINDKPLGTYIQ